MTEKRARASLAERLLSELAAGQLAEPAAFAEMFRAVAQFQIRFGGGSEKDMPGQATPVELFKYRRFTTFQRGTAARRSTGEQTGGYFLSSGTSQGAERRARHDFSSFALYETALARGFAQRVFGRVRLDPAWQSAAPRWNFFVPATARWWNDPHSSLAHMGRTLWQSLAANADATLHRIDPNAPDGELRRHVRALRQAGDRRTIGFGTGFGYLHLSERLKQVKMNLSLDARSQVMETGGYKGRGREVAPAELHAELAELFGLDLPQVFAEYGMTELSSQAYQVLPGVLKKSRIGPIPFPALPVYEPAESLRIRVVDAAGRPCLPGAVGLIEATDVMNLTSRCRLLLGDLGVVVPQKTPGRRLAGEFDRQLFQVLGRAQKLAARGCGLADDLQRLTGMQAQAATARA